VRPYPGASLVVLDRFRALAAEPPQILVGVAKVDITPDYPVRLSGYGSRGMNRRGGSTNLTKALAIGGQQHGGRRCCSPSKRCGVPASMADEVYQRLQSQGLRREQFVVSSSHSHTLLAAGICPVSGGEPVPVEHQQRMQQYRKELTDKMVQAVRQALPESAAARLSWAQGRVKLAANRRVLKDGIWTDSGSSRRAGG